ncbi:MAG: TylF/MycF/NovP-related O-methyltransferase [Candidatus Sulfotelmatobacter sp.]
MLRGFKEKVKRRIRYHLNRQLSEATKDIEFARQVRAAQKSAEFVDQHMKMAKSHPDKFALLKAAIEQVKIPGLYCEFGVYRGETLNFIASLATGEVHGFDSFEGLPEDWKQGHEKGTFALASLPEVQPNVRLHKGWFKDTIPAFREQHPEQIAFLHMDADLYSSTRTIFELLGDAIVAGTIIAFDEFFNYPGWCEGEYKAFIEFCRERRVDVHYLGFSRRGEQVAAKIARIAPKAWSPGHDP